MKISSLSTSSISTFDHCEHRFMLGSVLGIKEESNKAALLGTIFHKVFEQFARGIDLSSTELVKVTFEGYKKENDNLTDKDLSDLQTLVKRGLEFNSGEFDPRGKDILDVEKWFELEIGFNGDAIKLRGVIDLVKRIDDKTIEIVDYKTGASLKDFYTGKEKTEESLYKDHQIRLYHYAACKLYPTAENIIFTLYFVKLDKPFTIIIDKAEAYRAELFLKRKFDKIKLITQPRLNITWRCKMCDYSKKKMGTQSVCEFFRDKIRIEGLEKTIEEYKVKK